MRRMRMKTIRTWLNALAIVFVLIPAWRAAAVDVPLRQWQASLSWSSGPTPDQASPGIAPLALPSAPAQLVAITPCRIIDTRPGYPAAYAPGTKLQVGVTVTFDMNSAPAPCNTVPSNAVAYSLNVVAVGPNAAGFLSVFPGATLPTPLTSLLNFAAGDVVANASVVPGDDNGLVGFLSAATTDLVVDINGYYAPSSTAGSVNPMQVALLRWYPANLSASFAVGSSPAGVAFDGASICLATSSSNTVTKLRASGVAVQPGTRFAVGTNPTGVAF